jgi:hypothetical protein
MFKATAVVFTSLTALKHFRIHNRNDMLRWEDTIKMAWEARTGLIWLRIRTGGGPL